MKVLIVDDTAFMRAKIKMYFEKSSWDIIEAEDGEVAVDKYMLEKPDIVTMDITMPKMDGLEAAKQILAFDKGARIVMMTAMGQQGYIVEAMKSGVKDFIVKPFTEDRLNTTIEKLINAK